MRALLLSVLVACGGGTSSSPPPVSNQPPPPPPAEAAPVATDQPPPACSADGNLNKCAIDTLTYYSARMCACQDKACADGVNEALTKWGTEMATIAKEEKPDPDLAKRAADIMTRYADCMTKLMMVEPPPDPCGGGGGDNPCG